MKLSSADHNNMDKLLGNILDAHASGKVTRGEAIGVLAHIISALAIENPQEFNNWISDPAVFERWLNDTSQHRRS
ncbi:hypothetical protein [Rhizobium sp. G21]|uniref:hypothetical protein n=1 Tax=Rhizobium sp. G21 TaxID=2758439 RepID=UPI001600FDD3|nr:hypothetical protein [Rhizobium sp. G21]MBB1247475.1 hypothetical protein [Rhizobium sp. G21]